MKLDIVAHAYNPTSWKTETGISVNSTPASQDVEISLVVVNVHVYMS